MAIELQQVLLALVLAYVHFAVYAVIANLELGTKYTAGPRDCPPPDMSVGCGRLKRAYENFLETLPWFAIAVFAAHLAGKADDVVVLCGWTYLAARVVYVPAYWLGIPWVRSMIWLAATGAILVIVVRTLI